MLIRAKGRGKAHRKTAKVQDIGSFHAVQTLILPRQLALHRRNSLCLPKQADAEYEPLLKLFLINTEYVVQSPGSLIKILHRTDKKKNPHSKSTWEAETKVCKGTNPLNGPAIPSAALDRPARPSKHKCLSATCTHLAAGGGGGVQSERTGEPAAVRFAYFRAWSCSERKEAEGEG